MSVGFLTSSTLIATIKREAMIPTSESTFTNTDFLAMANQEVRIGLVPSIIQYHEEYYARDCAPIALVASQSSYPIPYRAVGGKFRELFYLDTNSNLRTMVRISADDRPYYQGVNPNNYVYFYLKGNDVVLVPDVGTDPVGSLVFTYYMRPNELVDEDRVATITAITVGASTTTYTVDYIPTSLTAFVQDGVTITGFSTNSKLDIMQTRPGHKTIVFDLFPTAVDTVGLQITFTTTDLDNSIIVGDYISFAGECIIPQVPSDLQDVLSQRVVLRCLQALGDKDGFSMATTKLTEMEKWSATLVDNRSEGQAKKVTNLRGSLRSAKIRQRGWV